MKKNNVVHLADGRKLGYAEYGNPQGKPVFYFHGWPGSRLRAGETHEIAKKLGVRIISIDRPGFGLSDFQENRTLMHWPADVAELADQLNIEKFAVVGLSGGAPYATVCAYTMPERITKVGIVVGLGPIGIKGAHKGVAWISKIGWANYNRFPVILKASTVLVLLQERVFKGKLNRLIMSKQDRRAIAHLTKKQQQIDTDEALAHKSIGLHHDLKVLGARWEFDPAKIKVPFYLWYGGADRNVSFNMAQYYASQIKEAHLTVYPNEGHFIMQTHADEILEILK